MWCPRCRQDLLETAFYRNKSRPSGRDGWCKECRLDYMRGYLEEVVGPEKIRQQQHEYRARHLESIRARQRTAAARRWRSRNTEQVRQDKAHAAGLVHWRNRPRLRAEILAEQHGLCAWCREVVDPDLRYPDPMSASLDHIHPVFAKGKTERSNLQVVHFRCNGAKGRLVRELQV